MKNMLKIPTTCGISYKRSGVNLQAAKELVKKIKILQPSIGDFSGKVKLDNRYIVGSTDGVGTKIKIASKLDKYDTIGQDLVAMNVNDILTCGADPLFFLDYIGTNVLCVNKTEHIIKSIIEACEMAECVLLGGETAEMGNMYVNDDVELVGSVVGSVKIEDYIDYNRVTMGDVIIGLKSSGIHSNGYSLVRYIVETSRTNLNTYPSWSDGKTMGEILLEPTIIYTKDVKYLKNNFSIKAIAHITGGGLDENINRVIPDGMNKILCHNWEKPEIFNWLQKEGRLDHQQMNETFNLGVGMAVIVNKSDADKILSIMENSFMIGYIY